MTGGWEQEEKQEKVFLDSGMAGLLMRGELQQCVLQGSFSK